MGKKAVSIQKIRFRQADPAQIMFFGEVFNLVHDAFEEFLDAAKIPWADWFNHPDYIAPLKQAHAEYYSPFKPGYHVEIQSFVKDIRNSSFLMEYHFYNKGILLATANTLHVFVNRKTGDKIQIPQSFKSALEVYKNE